MAFSRPTLTQIWDRIRGDLAGALETSPILRRAVAGVLGKALAGASHVLHGHLEWAAKQLFPDKADEEYLVRWAALHGLKQTPAAFAKGAVTLTGGEGILCPVGTIWQHLQTGNQYRTDADARIAGGTVSANLTAVTAGSTGNIDAGAELQILTPIPGLTSTATVGADGIDDGLPAESMPSLLQRLLTKLQLPPSGGNENDYLVWAKEVAGVTRSWVFPAQLGPGTVGLAFVVDNDPVTIIPDAAKVGEVQAHIAAVKPVTADATVFAPVPKVVAFSIAVTPDTPAVRAAVEDELDDLFLRIAAPGGASGVTGTIPLSQINEAISLAAGETDHVLSVPAADVTVTTGEMAIRGTVTWL